KTIKEIQNNLKPEEDLFMKLTTLRKINATSEFLDRNDIEKKDLLDEEEEQLLERLRNCEENLPEILHNLRQQNIDKMRERFHRYEEILKRIDNQIEKK
ncbi:MAG: hypothetical protein H7X79_11410, partial [Sporomusaceae bacterium]|nr:hypothetical protein [Sporomusaceae bacterium]